MNKKAINILSAATCEDENASSPRFINMKELPHINASKINIDQLMSFEFIGRKDNRVVQPAAVHAVLSYFCWRSHEQHG